MLPDYICHFKENPKSILAKIFGVFTVKMGTANDIILMLMENTVKLEDPRQLRFIFDLKGSMVGRLVKGKDLKPSTTLKDKNFLIARELYRENTLPLTED